MKITDLLKRESVELSRTPESKGQAIDQMVELMAKGGNINDLQRYKEGVLKREEEGTTGIGEGIAIPHAKTDAVSAPGLATMLVPQGVDYDALDGQPVHMIFLIAAPNTEENVHLEVLSRLSMLLMDDEFRKNLLDAADVTEFLAHIDEAERKKFPEEYGEEKQEQDQDQPEEGYRVLAVTACPTGIAHTYMAAESLENKANDVPDSGRIYRHGACGQTGIDARNRGRSSGKKRYDNGCRGGRLGVFWFLWRTDRRFCGRTDHARFKENSGKASKSAGGNKADAFVSVFGNRGNGSPYGICGQSAGRSIQ